MFLPSVVPTGRSVVPEAHQASRGSWAGHILLVEDDGDVRRSAQRLLEHVGFSVTALTDGREALALVRAQIPYDAIVSDVMSRIGRSNADPRLPLGRGRPGGRWVGMDPATKDVARLLGWRLF